MIWLRFSVNWHLPHPLCLFVKLCCHANPWRIIKPVNGKRLLNLLINVKFLSNKSNNLKKKNVIICENVKPSVPIHLKLIYKYLTKLLIKEC